MALTSDDGGRKKPKFSSMRQPPLIKQLKSILAEYPDGGQILKELIQNAEDAEANVVDIIFDNKEAGETFEPQNRYSKFFQGPAICIYNDALFEEDDWEGIKMIYSSKKEKNRLKVGRFGLGFKSVFHVTDYPCILSGDKILLINPHEEWKVNAEFDLNELDEYDDMDVRQLFKAFEGIHGITNETMQKGHFHGTLFRFPLRRHPSNLSDNMYDEKRVRDLFEAFLREISSIILFLKHLTKISLHERYCGNTKIIGSVEIVDYVDEVMIKRRKFNKEISELGIDYEGESVKSVVELSIETVMNKHKKKAAWTVVNVFMGNNVSEQFKNLIRDESVTYSPCVGIASPHGEDSEGFDGRIFCFLPLPNEGTKQTGFPFHINGFFALSQNRHHLKWATDEQKGQDITDKSIQWNQCLVEEALPFAFQVLIEYLVETCIIKNCNPEFVKNVYRCIPCQKNVSEKWMSMIQRMFQKIFPMPFLYVKKTSKWVTISEALFATFRSVKDQRATTYIVDALIKMDKNYVEIPLTLYESIEFVCQDISDLSPHMFVSFLGKSDKYKQLPNDVKIGIIEYVLHEGSYELLDDLELLPLQSGKWTRFSKSQEAAKVLVCTDEELKLIPGCENEILQRMKSLPKTVQDHFCNIIEEGSYNLRKFINENPPALIQKILCFHFGDSYPIPMHASKELNIHWLNCVWEYFLRSSIDISNVPILPVLKEGTWINPQNITLVRLSDILLLSDDSLFHDESYKCFENMSVTILKSLPEWIPLNAVKNYIYRPTLSSLGKLISRLGSSSCKESIIRKFNWIKEGNNDAIISIDNFVKRLHSLKAIDNASISFLQELDLFQQKSSESSAIEYVSLKRNSYFITCVNFPVKYPKKVLVCEKEAVPLMKLLQAVEITSIELIELSIRAIHDGMYTPCEIEKFMFFFIEQMKIKDFSKSIIQLASKINFLRCDGQLKTPSELFNPKDKQLRELFDDMSLFPDNIDFDDSTLKVLSKLGLHEVNDISEENILSVANYIETYSGHSDKYARTETKSKVLFDYLKTHTDMLCGSLNNTKGLIKLNNVRWLKVADKRPRNYPECLKFFSSSQKYYKPSEVTSIDWCMVIGSTMPLVEINKESLLNAFGWDKIPPLSKVIQHLQNLQMCFTEICKPEVSVAVKEVYKVLNENKTKVVEAFEEEKNKCLIWNGMGFSHPSEMIVFKSQNDIDIEPYFRYIPPEFVEDFSELMIQMGCQSKQHIDILLTCLNIINDQYLIRSKNERDVEKDLELIKCILEYLSNEQDNLTPERKARILIPVMSTSSDKIVLKPVLQCAYTNAPEEIDLEEEEFQFVHECISKKIIKALEVKSVLKQTLSDAEGFDTEEWGQSESLTNRLNRLLIEGYKDGLSVPKELIQNADDAGAKSVKFLYDERENETYKTKLLDPGMKGCQGPALWVFNDAFFTDKDFLNLKNLNGATKKLNTDKIGRFGLGFCSVYNLTDVPSLVSGSTIVILDPNRTNLNAALQGNDTGIKLDFKKEKNKRVFKKYNDQFIPYHNVFSCTASGEMCTVDGTLFRFPLRTLEQSHTSEISETPYTQKRMIDLLKMFIASAGDAFLFTQNIKKIEIFHLGKDATSPLEMKQIFTVCRDIEKVNEKGLYSSLQSCNILNKVAGLKLNTKFSEIQLLHIDSKFGEEAKQLLNTCSEDSSTSWVVSWSTCEVKDEVKFECKNEGALPLAAIAVPLTNSEPVHLIPLQKIRSGFKADGHLFCFLQLPEKTDLHFHINGCFGVSSDRRQLFYDSEDEQRSFYSRWNEIIMRNAVVNAFIHLLLLFAKTIVPTEYSYCSLWPIEPKQTTQYFIESFYENIVNRNDVSVFKALDSWICFENAVILDPFLRKKDIGDIALKMLQQFSPRHGKKIIEMESVILNLLKKYNEDKADYIGKCIIQEEEMLVHLLKTIHEPVWDKIERDKMIIFSLTSDLKSVRDLLKKNECIPSEPIGNLRRPNQLVNPKSKLGELFENDDGYFPRNNTEFERDDILSILCELGMIHDILPHEILLERCQSVEQLTKKCSICAYDRSIRILEYLNKKEVIDELKKDIEILNRMRNIKMLPIMQCPKDWTFKWGANVKPDKADMTDSAFCKKHARSVPKYFGQPSEMYRQSTKFSVGLLKTLVDESNKTDMTLDTLRLVGKMDISIDILMQQIRDAIVENRINGNFKLLENILKDIFNILNLHIIAGRMTDKDMSQLEKLSPENIIPVDDILVAPKNIAVELERDCRPYIYKVPKIFFERYKALFMAFRIRYEFCVNDILAVMTDHLKPLCEKMIEKEEPVNNLLYNLYKNMEQENIKYEDLRDRHDVILAPDETKILRKTSELAFQDGDFQTRRKIHMVHESISWQIAQKIGVRKKERLCLKKISRGMPFGQKESLVTRLNGLLRAYPADTSIMKELLQNADDACATELYFIKDLQKHKFDENFGCRKLNEPSLCVFNDSYFSEKDLLGIQNLGKGSKGDDPTKTGQFGVGFNAVYHLTDIPSFLTIRPGYKHDGTLCIFDPLFEYIPDLEEPGLRCELDGVREDFPDVLLGFCRKVLTDKCTLFRFPLRLTESAISKNVVKENDLVTLLNDFKSEMFEVLLFLKNITCIKILDITSGQLKEEYVVRAHISEEDKKKRDLFFKRVKQVCDKNKIDKYRNLEEKRMTVHYEIKIEDSKKRIQNWLIVQAFGFNDRCSDENSLVIKAFKNNDLGHLPLGGIALPITDLTNRKRLNDFQKRFEHETKKAYCFLPLPIETKLPVQVNGHFAVDAARRYLMEDNFRHEWNMKLVEHTIVPAWVLGISVLKELKINPLFNSRNSKTCLRKVLDIYHLYFPTGNAENSFWTECVKMFYEHIHGNEVELFPYLDVNRISQNGMHTLQWSKIHSKTCKWTGVFKSEDIDRHNQLSYVLKRLGMKIIESPLYIYNIMTEIGLQTCETSPDHVISFLKSFRSTDIDRCVIYDVGQHITTTRFESDRNINYVICHIIGEENFLEKSVGLPILLSEDGFLHVCSTENALFLTEHYGILPKSPELFLHRKLVPRFSKYLDQVDYLKDFTVDVFLKFLHISCDQNSYRMGLKRPWENTDTGVVTIPWLCRVFNFIFEKSNEETECFKENIKGLNDWSFLPTSTFTDGVEQKHLIPIKDAYTCTSLGKNLRESDLKKILNSLNLPKFDKFVFNVNTFSLGPKLYPFVDAIESLVSSEKEPYKLLKFLVYHRNEIQTKRVSPNDAFIILDFFARCLNELQSSEKCSLQDLHMLLKQMPFYVTHENILVSIDRCKVGILPPDIPLNGIKELTKATCVTLLRYSIKARQLHDFLCLPSSDAFIFYAETFLPNISCIRKKDLESHIIFIRDHWLNELPQREKLLEKLKDVPFIEKNGRWRKASDFYDMLNPVFQEMCQDSDFLPKTFRKKEWGNFLKQLGLKVQVSDQDLLRFASNIEADGQYDMNEVIQKKSKTLEKCLISRQDHWEDETIWRLRTIKFIVPYVVTDKLTDIQDQPQKASNLICLNGVVRSSKENLCWTTCNLISEEIYAKIKDRTKQLLNILDTPNDQNVFRHCQHVCLNMSQRMKEIPCTLEKADIQWLMKKFYTYFKKNDLHGSVKTLLNHTPFIYVPDHDVLVTVATVVLDQRDPIEDLIPYFYNASLDFGPFFSFFEKIGCHQVVTCSMLITVLHKIYLETENMKENIKIEVVKSVLDRFFHLLQGNESHRTCITANEILYLPNRSGKLKNAKDIVVSDCPSFEYRLQLSLHDTLFIDLKKLDIEISDVNSLFKTLPEYVRPQFLSEIVTEITNHDSIAIVQSSSAAESLTEFIHSPELLSGLLRLIKHSSNIQIGNDLIAEVKSKLSNVKCIEVSFLQTVLKLRDEIIHGSERNKSCSIIRSRENKTLFYFKTRNNGCLNNRIIVGPDGLSCLIIELIHYNMNTRILIDVLTCYISNENIADILNDQNINAFDLPDELNQPEFPVPGKYVAKKMIPHLERGLHPFPKHEFKCLALQLKNDGSNEFEQEPLYIYVHAIEEIRGNSNIETSYKLKTGNTSSDLSKFPIYQIYRFVSKESILSETLDLPKSKEEFAAACLEVKQQLQYAFKLPDVETRIIIERLLLDWCIKKSDGNEFASKVFDYIHEIVQRLENNEAVEVNPFSLQGRADISRSRYFTLFKMSVQYGSSYAREHQSFKNEIRGTGRRKMSHGVALFSDQSYSSSGCFVWQHFQRRSRGRRSCWASGGTSPLKRQRISDMTESKRWLKQAKLDFSIAVEYNDASSTSSRCFNWVCYISHQACEKAMKAVWFFTDAENTLRHSHDLITLATGIGEEFVEKATLFETKIIDYARMRYPDTVTRPNIPAEIYSADDAEYCLERAKEIIDLAEESIRK